MSIKVQQAVRDARIPNAPRVAASVLKFVLYVLADFANDDGGDIFPSLATVAGRTQLDRSTVIRSIRRLLALTLLVCERPGGRGARNVTRYRIDLSALAGLPRVSSDAPVAEAEGAPTAPLEAAEGSPTATLEIAQGSPTATLASNKGGPGPLEGSPTATQSISERSEEKEVSPGNLRRGGNHSGKGSEGACQLGGTIPAPPVASPLPSTKVKGRASKQRHVSEAETAALAEAYTAYNAAAETQGFTRCVVLTEKIKTRLLARLRDIGDGDLALGVSRFKDALSAIPLDLFLSGKRPPKKAGDAPFRMNIDRLMSTDSKLLDVLARLISLHVDHETASRKRPMPSASASYHAAWDAAVADELEAQQRRNLN